MNKKHFSSDSKSLIVNPCNDFKLNGKGDHPEWEKADWIEMNPLGDNEVDYETKFKILYSPNGIYVLSYCEDKLVSTTYDKDQGDVWEGDVFEVFLHTDPSHPFYFEYEINPLNTELVLLIPNDNGDFMGWGPWHYEGERKIKKAVHVMGGEAKSGSKIDGWTAEMFFPYVLLKGFKNAPPAKGTKWTGNFYRMDYDSGNRTNWSWAPIERNFHEYKNFWSIIFN